MTNKLLSPWAELSYQFQEIVDCVHLKAFFASLPAAFAAHFLGDWHLLEIWFAMTCVDLLAGVWLAVKQNKFSWDKIGSWTFKMLVHACTIIAVGILAHAASIALKYDILILNVYLLILIMKELGSTVRNMLDMGWPVPRILVIIVSTVDRKAEKKVVTMLNTAFGDDEQNSPTDNSETEDK